jgi:hypothetical protein
MKQNSPASYTQYWLNGTWDREANAETERIEHTASNKFRSSGVGRGDFLYLVTIKQGRLHVANCMRVGSVSDTKTAQRILSSRDLWDAKDHVIADKASPCDFQRVLPTALTRQLRFLPGNRPLTFVRGTNRLDGQTLRGVRRLTDESARMLASFVNETRSRAGKHRSPATMLEGASFETTVDKKERNRQARAACIAKHGYKCRACDQTMESIYGSIGHNLIHVHHVKPLSRSKGRRRVDATRDLVPVCPNCHAIIHRFDPPLSIRTVRKALSDRS